MTAAQMKIAFIVAGALLLWWLAKAAAAAAAPGTVTKELTICADVEGLTCDFGTPIEVSSSTPAAPTADEANHQRLLELVAESNTAIANYDATHPEASP